MKQVMFGRAHRTGLIECGGECSVHIVLYDNHEVAFADVPLNPALCRRIGKTLVRIGLGEDVPKVLLEEGWKGKP